MSECLCEKKRESKRRRSADIERERGGIEEASELCMVQTEHDRDREMKERKRPREQSKRGREREVERERLVARAIPGQLFPVCLH